MHMDLTSILVSGLPVLSWSYEVLSIELQYASQSWTMSFHIHWVLQNHSMISLPIYEQSSDTEQSCQWAHYELSNAFIQHATSSRTQPGIERVSGRPKAYGCRRYTSSIRIDYRAYRPALDSATRALLNPFASLILKAEQAAYTGSATWVSREHTPYRRNIHGRDLDIHIVAPRLRRRGKEAGRRTQVNLLCIGDFLRAAQ